MRGTTADGSAGGRLAGSDEPDEPPVADGAPDVRGWGVKTDRGKKIGRVDGLLVDAAATAARYLDVALDAKALGLPEDRHVLMPFGVAWLDYSNEDVLMSGMTTVQIIALPTYVRGKH